MQQRLVEFNCHIETVAYAIDAVSFVRKACGVAFWWSFVLIVYAMGRIPRLTLRAESIVLENAPVDDRCAVKQSILYVSRSHPGECGALTCARSTDARIGGVFLAVDQQADRQCEDKR